MARAQLTNNAATTLAAAITSTAATTFTVSSGGGALFPSSGYFYVTLLDAANVPEIVRCTTRVGDTFTVTRAQDSTTARTFLISARVSLNLTAVVINELAPLDGTGASGTWGIIAANATTAAACSGNSATATAATTATHLAGGAGGQVPYQTAAGATALLPNGTVGQMLQSGGGTAAPSWSSAIPATATINTFSVGYKEIPQNSQAAGYTLVLGDSGKHVYMNTAGAFTIPSNASVAFPIGTAVTFYNPSASSTIAITADTMYLAGPGTTGTRTLAQYGVATALKITATSWVVSGSGLS